MYSRQTADQNNSEGRSFRGASHITEILMGMNGFSVQSPSNTYVSKGKDTLLVACTVCGEIWSLHLTHPEEQWAATTCAPTPDSEPVPQSRVLTGGTTLTCLFLTVGETGAPRENTCEHRKNIQTPHRKALPQPGIEPRTFLL